MLNLKKTAVAVLALSSSAVFAGTMGPVCSAVNVTVPCESTAWDFGARALYLQPAYSGGDYSYVAVNDTTGQYQDYNQSWMWGFFLEASYHYNTGNDANLNWYHIGKATARNFSNDATFLGGVDTESGRSSINPKWDAVNLEFGQHVDFGENKNIRFHGGFQYARIANTVKVTGINSSSVNNGVNFTAQSKPTYNGFGARAGADLGYGWENGLGVYANGAAALLAGTAKISNSFTSNTGVAATPNASKTTLVPELEAKLGLKYGYAMAQGDLTLDVGWMWINYFNATQAIQSSVVTGLTPQVVGGDFGLQGLYFGLNWLGNVA